MSSPIRPAASAEAGCSARGSIDGGTDASGSLPSVECEGRAVEECDGAPIVLVPRGAAPKDEGGYATGTARAVPTRAEPDARLQSMVAGQPGDGIAPRRATGGLAEASVRDVRPGRLGEAGERARSPIMATPHRFRAWCPPRRRERERRPLSKASSPAAVRRAVRRLSPMAVAIQRMARARVRGLVILKSFVSRGDAAPAAMVVAARCRRKRPPRAAWPTGATPRERSVRPS